MSKCNCDGTKEICNCACTCTTNYRSPYCPVHGMKGHEIVYPIVPKCKCDPQKEMFDLSCPLHGTSEYRIEYLGPYDIILNAKRVYLCPECGKRNCNHISELIPVWVPRIVPTHFIEVYHHEKFCANGKLFPISNIENCLYNTSICSTLYTVAIWKIKLK